MFRAMAFCKMAPSNFPSLSLLSPSSPSSLSPSSPSSLSPSSLSPSHPQLDYVLQSNTHLYSELEEKASSRRVPCIHIYIVCFCCYCKCQYTHTCMPPVNSPACNPPLAQTTTGSRPKHPPPPPSCTDLSGNYVEPLSTLTDEEVSVEYLRSALKHASPSFPFDRPVLWGLPEGL